jgi:hypothetical protein
MRGITRGRPFKLPSALQPASGAPNSVPAQFVAATGELQSAPIHPVTRGVLAAVFPGAQQRAGDADEAGGVA